MKKIQNLTGMIFDNIYIYIYIYKYIYIYVCVCVCVCVCGRAAVFHLSMFD